MAVQEHRSVRMSEELDQRLDDAASTYGTSKSQFIRLFIETGLDKLEAGEFEQYRTESGEEEA